MHSTVRAKTTFQGHSLTTMNAEHDDYLHRVCCHLKYTYQCLGLKDFRTTRQRSSYRLGVLTLFDRSEKRDAKERIGDEVEDGCTG
jgi:hypothetical protein